MKWANKAGLVSSQAQFDDVYGLDEEVCHCCTVCSPYEGSSLHKLLGMVSKPVKALILLFPDNGELAAKRAEDDVKIEESGQPALDPTIFWIKQTVSVGIFRIHGSSPIHWCYSQIRNACGTMALIHALANVSRSIRITSCVYSLKPPCHKQSNVTFVPESPLAKFIDQCKGK